MSLRLKDLLSFPQECAPLFVSIWKHLPDRWVIFPSRKGPTGQKGIHRDLVSNGAVDIQLLLALKPDNQVISIWPLMSERSEKYARKNEQHVKKSHDNNVVKLKISTLISWASYTTSHRNSSRQFRAVKWLHNTTPNPLKPPRLNSMCWEAELPECGLHTNDGHFVLG